MPRARFAHVSVFVALTLAIVGAQQRSPANRPWPPGVQKVSPASPVLSPADALKTFYMAPGYHLELVASEPLIQEPVALDWDLQGRLWAVEMPGFMADLTGSNEHDPIGRVVVLEDSNGDGTMDKRTVFADHLVLARSIKVLDRGVLVAEPPNVWLMRDTDGDLRADDKQLVTTGFGRFEGDPQVGRRTGRCRTDLSQHERVGAARRSRSHVLLRAQSQPRTHARQLRAHRG